MFVSVDTVKRSSAKFAALFAVNVNDRVPYVRAPYGSLADTVSLGRNTNYIPGSSDK